MLDHPIVKGKLLMPTLSPVVYTVLIVDDNPQLLLIVSTALHRLGNFTVVTAHDGIDGLTKLYEVQPDCMIIDVRMPGLNGYQLVRTIRGDPATASTPLIMLTAMIQDKDRFAGIAAGADQYVIKPVKPLDLVAAIQRAIFASDEERARHLKALASEDEAKPDSGQDA
jgi:CheY-like chemotaxis protein